jgi:hypothetical protein
MGCARACPRKPALRLSICPRPPEIAAVLVQRFKTALLKYIVFTPPGIV